MSEQGWNMAVIHDVLYDCTSHSWHELGMKYKFELQSVKCTRGAMLQSPFALHMATNRLAFQMNYQLIASHDALYFGRIEILSAMSSTLIGLLTA